MGTTVDSGYTFRVGGQNVIVHRSYDPILIEHLGEMLRDSGLSARVVGTRSAALIGVGPSITELNLSVPRSEAAEAYEFLEAFFADEGEEHLASEGLLDDEEDDEDESVDKTRLRPIFAGVGMMFCGLGHLYARRRVTSMLLAAGFICGIILMPNARTQAAVVGGIIGLLSLIFLDLFGARRAVRQHNRGEQRGVLAQIAVAVGYIAVAGGLSALPNLYTKFHPPLVPEESAADGSRYGDEYGDEHDRSDQGRLRHELSERRRNSNRPHLLYDFILDPKP